MYKRRGRDTFNGAITSDITGRNCINVNVHIATMANAVKRKKLLGFTFIIKYSTQTILLYFFEVYEKLKKKIYFGKRIMERRSKRKMGGERERERRRGIFFEIVIFKIVKKIFKSISINVYT